MDRCGNSLSIARKYGVTTWLYRVKAMAKLMKAKINELA